MSMTTITKPQQRKNRVRSRIHGTAERPRLSVHISNRHATVQLVDDVAGQTLAYVTTAGQKAGDDMTAKAAWAGQQIAKAAKKRKIQSAVFDRGSRRYLGRLRAMAEAARAEGLEL